MGLTGWSCFHSDTNLNMKEYSLVEVKKGETRTILTATGLLEPISEVSLIVWGMGIINIMLVSVT